MALCCVFSSDAQDYGNEWIDFNQTYYKIDIASRGIYRLSYSDLQSAGFPVGQVIPDRIQMFHRGEEIAINLFNPGFDATLDPGDYLEFYGEGNDGTLDELLYLTPSDQPHKFYSLFSDTTAYFLTWNLGAVNGKRMDDFTENNVPVLPAESYYLDEQRVVLTEEYSLGRTTNAFISSTVFERSEGWTSTLLQEGNSRDFLIQNIDDAVTTAGKKPSVEILLIGRNIQSHDVEILVGPDAGSLRSLGTYAFNQFDILQINEEIEFTDISAFGQVLLRVDVLSNGGLLSNISISYYSLQYPRTWDMFSQNTEEFDLEVNPGDRSYFEIDNVPGGVTIYDITDKENIRTIGYGTSGSMINAVIDQTNISRKLFVNTGFSTPEPNPVSFRSFDPATYNYVIITHPLLQAPSTNYSNPVEAYAGYRSSSQGGSYDTLIANIDQLYNQFSYGEKTPLSIFNFMRRNVDLGSMEHLFIIGKGLDVFFNYHRNDPATFNYPSLVPSAGTPGSDMFYTAGLDGTPNVPAVPTGRITASVPGDVEAYLDKVIEFESTPFDDLWRKRVLHLSGGITAQELVRFRDYMDGFGAVAEDVYFGGQVKTIQKESNSISELINIADDVNAGLNLITFYGHSAPGITDIEIGKVRDEFNGYQNNGRYPFFLINGCNAGDVFSDDLIWGEDWILAPGRGSVGFIAHSFFGFETPLVFYSDQFYATAQGDSVFVNKTVGEVQKEVSERYLQLFPTSELNITQVQQMVLQGDPALVMFGAGQPDFDVQDPDLVITSFTNDPVTTKSDSFLLEVTVRNFGIGSLDSLDILVERTLSDGSMISRDTLSFPSILFQDTLLITLRNEEINIAGTNTFRVELDPLDEITELSETNNIASTDFFIPVSGTLNLAPYNFSIEGSQPITFNAQPGSPQATSRDFLFELDTSNLFNSPFLQQTSATGQGIVTWTTSLLPDIAANDSTVYYWRTRYANPLPTEDDSWQTSSFVYIKDSPEGWAQASFPQFGDNPLTGLEVDTISRVWNFPETITDVESTTYGDSHPNNFTQLEVNINGLPYILPTRLCRNDGISLVAFDKSTTIPYAPIPNEILNTTTCGRTPQVINTYSVNPDVNDFITNLTMTIDAVQDGDFVLLFSLGNAGYSSWMGMVQTKLEEVGGTPGVLTALSDGDPYLLLGRKGSGSGVTLTELSGAATDSLTIISQITGKFTDGTLRSPRIGPALSWGNLDFNISISELPQSDEFDLDIWGVSLNGVRDFILNTSNPVADLSSIVDVNVNPFLEIDLHVKDTANLTPPQLNNWFVIFDPAPEGTVFFSGNDDNGSLSLTKQEGEIFNTQFGFVNITDINFTDSLTVETVIFNQDSRELQTSSFRIEPVAAMDTVLFTVTVDTRGLSGLNNLTVNVNPLLIPEQNYTNNAISLNSYFNVTPDETNPLIEVVVDGQYIMDGEIISPNPVILITLRDENQFLFKNDTTGVDIRLKYPEEDNFTRVNFSDPTVQWTPADQQNDYEVEYQPQNLVDGIYELQVQASDVSGNNAGADPYTIRFEVVNESTVTHFYTYPNPFSTSTRFIFTLTGTEIPDQIKIQIMTVSGKIVREITQDELGPVRIGNNVSDFAWDGRDEFGDQLANGVYLYRVLMRINGVDVKLRSSGGDKGFTKGFGKIYLLK